MPETTENTEYVSAAQASRILGVTQQRVSAMVRDGDLPCIRPWPRAVRIPVEAVTAWQAGERPAPVHRTACREYVLNQADTEALTAVSVSTMNALTNRFINERRPDWEKDDREAWAAAMAARLLRGS